MKFTVAVSDLETALKLVTPALASSGGDLSGHFLFRVSPSNPSRIEVLTYSGRVSAGSSFVADLKDADRASFSIEGKRLLTFIGALAVSDKAAVLLFDDSKEAKHAETMVTLMSPSPTGEYQPVENSSQYFGSLDPSHFPYVDKYLAAALVTAKVPGARLAEALDVAKLFTSDDESKTPELCVVEIADGVMSSTNSTAAAHITSPFLKGSKLRAHFKDIGAISSYLSLAGEEDVEILESEKNFFFRRLDGSYFGETKFSKGLPAFGKPGPTDQYQFFFSKKELNRVIRGLEAGAAQEDTRIQFSVKDANTLFLSMENVGGKTVRWELRLTSTIVDPEAKPLPDKINTTTTNIKRLLNSVEGDGVVLGASRFKNTGYFRTATLAFAPKAADGSLAPDAAAKGDNFITMIIWSKS